MKECLLLQIQHKLNENPEHKLLQDAKAILEECFEEFSRKHYEKISRKLRLSDTELKQAIDEILKLIPSPGGQSPIFLTDNRPKRLFRFYARFGRWRIGS